MKYQGNSLWLAEVEVCVISLTPPYVISAHLDRFLCYCLQIEQNTVVEYRYLIRDLSTGKLLTESTVFRRLCLVSRLTVLYRKYFD